MPEQNPTLSVRIADFLEQVAEKIRSLTVDRAANAITWAAVALIFIVGAVLALIWLLVGIFRILGALMGVETAYAVVGLVLIVVGAFVWSRRYPQDRTSEE
ncbi:MAG: hypothetical protein QNJ71_04280 [Acidimicrobiia bacterium]|nr:hypothetical protein [Acidimicrobiia bacterium]